MSAITTLGGQSLMNFGASQHSSGQHYPVSRRVWLAAFGLFFPYVVGVVSILVLGSRVSDHNFYLSGGLATADTVTQVLTLVSFLLGLCLCTPFVVTTFRDRTAIAKTLLFLALVIGIVVHLVCVFALRLFTYLEMGGIWP